MTVRYTNLPDNKDKIFGGAYSVHDWETCKFRDYIIQEYVYKPSDPDLIKEEFISTYREWMPSTHNLIGIEKFTAACFTQGTTESFAQFYIRYKTHKRLRLKKGEYFYHQMMQSLWYNHADGHYLGSFCWLDEDEIRPADLLLISVPFSDTGVVPSDLEDILNSCDKHKVPVMLDLAYINLTVDQEINLEHPCIEYIVSSLSKVFPVENHRIGIRLQRKMFEDQIYVINEKGYNYINLLSAYLGAAIMKKFPADYIYNKYKEPQTILCDHHNLEPSPCVNFGIDTQNKFPEYNRGNDTNRLCFSRIWDGRADEL
jgi:hypothetical protein